jgi:hypothetical protein
VPHAIAGQTRMTLHHLDDGGLVVAADIAIPDDPTDYQAGWDVRADIARRWSSCFVSLPHPALRPERAPRAKRPKLSAVSANASTPADGHHGPFSVGACSSHCFRSTNRRGALLEPQRKQAQRRLPASRWYLVVDPLLN